MLKILKKKGRSAPLEIVRGGRQPNWNNETASQASMLGEGIGNLGSRILKEQQHAQVPIQEELVSLLVGCAGFIGQRRIFRFTVRLCGDDAAADSACGLLHCSTNSQPPWKGLRHDPACQHLHLTPLPEGGQSILKPGLGSLAPGLGRCSH